MASNSDETFPWVGRMGLPLFVGLRDLDLPELRLHVQAYRKAWTEAGHSGRGDVCLRIPVYAAPTAQAAIDEPRENTMHFFRRHVELLQAGLGRGDTGPADRRRAKVAKLAKTPYEEILETRVAFGTAAALVERFRRVRDELGLSGIVVELNPGGLLALEPMVRTLRILTHEVIPALK